MFGFGRTPPFFVGIIGSDLNNSMRAKSRKCRKWLFRLPPKGVISPQSGGFDNLLINSAIKLCEDEKKRVSLKAKISFLRQTIT